LAGVVGIAVGALLASPAMALVAGPLASADTTDDLVTIGPYTIDGYTDTFTYDSDTSALDNYLVGFYDSYPYDLDAYSGGPGSDTSEVLFTVPLLFQGGFDDVDGTITPLYSFDPFDFVSPDTGLVDLGGAGAPPAGIVTIGPFPIDGDTDTLSLTANSAFDNYLVGSLSSTTFDLDVYSGAPGSDTGEVLLTIPSLLQVGIDDVGGAITPLFSFAGVDAIAPDIGLLDLGGL
jgi:hypothetical protein